ncbi:hypothetical protein DFJ63DRAFT_320460, partial [Scheffersomyces coipomensis]|uniref:uncharacterized protein n=1 Tax=Scheffersomyces coipomensis TaxID=1788519 RepID=UPI00315C93CA
MELDDLYDINIIRKSTKFVIDHLFVEPDYNYFNNSTQNEEQEKYWKELCENFEIKTVSKKTNKFNLTLERRKLIFLVFSFHNISSKNYFRYFDKDYISSKEFERDISQVINKGFKLVIIEMERKRKLYKKGNIKSIINIVSNLFGVSWGTKLSLPLRILKENKTRVGSLSTRRLFHRNSRQSLNIPVPKVFEDYFQVVPRINELNVCEITNNYLDSLISELRIDRCSLEKIEYSGIGKSRWSGYNKCIVINYIEQYVLNPTCNLLDIMFCESKKHKITLGLQEGVDPDVISDITIKFHKSKSEVIIIPVEVKTGGVSSAYESRNKENKKSFHEIFNQISYQMITNNSKLGFIMDMESILIVQFEDIRNVSRKQCLNDYQFHLNCRMRCLKYLESDYSINLLLVLLSNQCFIRVPKTQLTHMNELFHTLEMTERDKQDIKEWQLSFMRKDWKSKFGNYDLNEHGDYIHRDEKSLIIPAKCFKCIELIDWVIPSLEEDDFIIDTQKLRPDPTESQMKYFSQVSKVYYKNIDDPNYRSNPMILKVYNPIMGFQRGILPKYAFLESYASLLCMFLNEIQVFLALRHTDSSNNSNNNINYLPCLFQYGMCEFSTTTEFQGFYLLEEYIQPTRELRGKELYDKAEISLMYMHKHNILHGDIHNGNFIYNKEKDRVFFIDFGMSKLIKSRKFKPSYEATLKEKEMKHLAKTCGVYKRYPCRYKRQRH